MKCCNCKNLAFEDVDGEQYQWCDALYDSKDIDEERQCNSFIPATIADAIRSMTDEKMADFLRWYSDTYSRGNKDWSDFLKQEADI